MTAQEQRDALLANVVDYIRVLIAAVRAEDAERLRALEAVLVGIEDLLRLREDGSTPTGESVGQAWLMAIRALALLRGEEER